VAESSIVRVEPGFEDEWDGARADSTEVFINLIRAGDLANAIIESFVRERGLPSSTAFMVLEVVRGAGSPISPSEVASRAVMSRPALSGAMNTLEQRGLLLRSPDPTDRRRALVEITAKGRQVMEALLPELHRAEVEWTKSLSANQKETLLRELGRLYGDLKR
jgi:DNA-binding MarR family transcriptional regulator